MKFVHIADMHFDTTFESLKENLGDDKETIYKKIVECGERNEDVVLQMITLASNWNYNIVSDATQAYNNRKIDYNKWLIYKKRYFNYFLEIKQMWDDSKFDKEINTYNELFGKEDF